MNFAALGFELVDLILAAWIVLKILVVAVQRSSIPGSPEILVRHATILLLYAGGIRILARFKASPMVFLAARTAGLYAVVFLLFGADPLAWLRGLIAPWGVDALMGCWLSAQFACGARPDPIGAVSQSRHGNLGAADL